MVILDVETLGREGSWLPPWAALLAWLGLLLLGALVLGMVMRAIVRRRRYDALDILDAEARAALQAAVVAAERRTRGEIVPVILERSDRHADAALRAALAALLVASLLLASWIPWERPLLVLAIQLGAAAVGWLLARVLPDLQRAFVSEARATEVAEEQAVQEFHRLGLHRTQDATGVLLFVSLLERRVIVLGDRGIHERVGDAHWTATTQAVLDGIARGSLRDGLLAGIVRCADVLAEHFPAQRDDVNELEDRVVVRKE